MTTNRIKMWSINAFFNSFLHIYFLIFSDFFNQIQLCNYELELITISIRLIIHLIIISSYKQNLSLIKAFYTHTSVHQNI